MIKTVFFFLKELTHRLTQHPFQALQKAFSAQTWHRILVFAVGETIQTPFVPVLPKEILRDLKSTNLSGFLARHPKIELPEVSSPLVSIIVPVYNQILNTLYCLESLRRHHDDIAFEVILADDCSTDETQQIAQWVGNLKVSRTSKNCGFLENCNTAARVAQGEFLLFLNNDTYVQPGWLKPLVETFNDPRVGMSGSMLVYPDGTLQEAGVIIWNDATGANCGRDDSPTKPEFNFVRDVDSISGASILVRRRVFEEIGGFDRRFIPAYYEDTDLAFEIRRRGLVVRYQPRSKVIHFEGVSHGRDLNAGIKKHQVDNRIKFLEKWGAVLKAEHFAPGTNPFRARQRDHRGTSVLVVDTWVPDFDGDAGRRCTWQYLVLLHEMGYKVVFLPDDFKENQPYTSVLQSMGIEVLAGAWYKNNAKVWLESHLDDFEVALLHRPEVATKWIPILRKSSRVKVVYHGHDLHFLRFQRQFEITKDRRAKRLSQSWKVQEDQIFRDADHVLTVSHEEKILIDQITQSPATCSVMPLLFYPEGDSRQAPGWEGRSGLLFVGGFTHLPNGDAVRWMVSEILPLLPCEVILTVVGPHASPELLALASPRVRFLGRISDEDLAMCYDRTALVVTPLRFGAGVKGKVIEAFRYGVPVVGTSVAFEGLGLDLDQWATGDTAETFAGQVRRLLESSNDWNRAVAQGKQVLERDFTRSRAQQVMELSLGPPGGPR